MNNSISYDDFIEQVSTNKSVFLCGNGFSINFDKRFKWYNLMSLLYSTHQTLARSYDFDVTPNSAMKNVVIKNFQDTLYEISKLNTKEKFEVIFEDAAAFAHSIVDSSKAIEWFKSNANNQLRFGYKISDMIEAIVEEADNAKYEKYSSVNYEYWTILIYCVIAMQNAPEDVYLLNSENIFVRLVLIGGKLTLQGTDTYEKTITNGVYTYFRFLFSGNILLQGDAVRIEQLDNWNTLDLDKIRNFLDRFAHLLTTNYDHILDEITHREILHLHGAYNTDKYRVLGMSLGMSYNSTRYDLSTIVIGDYFVSKSYYQATAKIATSHPNNTSIELYEDMIKRVVEVDKSNVVVIFGLSIDNDYHIIRSIQTHIATVSNPHIIYCYYTDADKAAFQDTYSNVITYAPQLSEAVKNVKVSFMNSKEIINKIFETTDNSLLNV